ncbi:MAG TPA: pentapeptide repeat-containing protein [Stellaceae bacterium]|nr:pentapeptide repeat-containing protein [Stellaceae bacterium]
MTTKSRPSPVLVKVRIDAAIIQAVQDRHVKFLRNQSGGQRAMLRQCDLAGLDMHGMDWSESELLVCRFDGANLERAMFRNANLFGAKLNDCNLAGADFAKADLRGAKFERANLSGAHLGGADLREGMVIDGDVTLDGDTASRFTNAILNGTKLNGARCRSVDFSGAILQGTDFSDADLRSASFHGAALIDPVLRGAQLAQTDFRSAILKGDVGQRLKNSGASLPAAPLRLEAVADRLEQHALWVSSDGKQGRRANLTGCNLEGVDLSGRMLAAARLDYTILVSANLQGAMLAAAVLTGANLQGANLTGAELRGADLRFSNLRDTVLDNTKTGSMPGLALKTVLQAED